MAGTADVLGECGPSGSPCLRTAQWDGAARRAVFELLSSRPPAGLLPPRDVALLRSLPVYPTLCPTPSGALGTRSTRPHDDGGRTSLDAGEDYATCPAPLLSHLPGVVRGERGGLPGCAVRWSRLHVKAE